MSDSDEDDYSYHYSDSDLDDSISSPKARTSGATISAADAQFAVEKRFLRESPKAQKPWVDFCVGVLRTVGGGKEEQRERWFDNIGSRSRKPTTTTTTTTTTALSSASSKQPTPSKLLSNSYLMCEYDVPALNSLTVTLIDGRDDVRGVFRLTVPWPDIKDATNAEDVPISVLAVSSPFYNPDQTLSVNKRGKQTIVKNSQLQELKALTSPWKGSVVTITPATRKAHDTNSGGGWKMVYHEGDSIMTVKSTAGCPMDILAKVDGEVTFREHVKLGIKVECGDVLGKVDVKECKEISNVKSASKVREEERKSREKAKIRLQEERMIYPTVPPTIEWLGPRLPFQDMVRIMFIPEIQPDRWNLCTDLEVMLMKIFRIVLDSSVVDRDLNLGKGEKLLLKLVQHSRIYSNEDEDQGTDQKLVSFGVSKTFALADGKGDDAHVVTKKQKIEKDEGNKVRGFAKGTGYSGDARGARGGESKGGKAVKGSQQLALEVLRDLFKRDVREGLDTDVLLNSILPTFCYQKLTEASWITFEKEATDYMYVVLWGGELFEHLKSSVREKFENDHGGKRQTKKVGKELQRKLLPIHKFMLNMDEEWDKIGGYGGAGKKVAWKTWVNRGEAKEDKGIVQLFTSDDLRNLLGSVCRMMKSDVGKDWRVSDGSAVEEGEDDDMDVVGAEEDKENVDKMYKASLGPKHVDTVEKFTQHIHLGEVMGTRDKKQMKRLAMEFSSFSSMLPLELHGAIFVRWSETQTNLFKVLIIAPADTPYGGGAFVFDCCIPPDYPNVPPKVILATTGGGRWRFNPNLYDNGKVCLSLLGTWAGEPWDREVSNLTQVFMSIYGLIFVEEPFFNEPGYQGQRGTKAGDDQNSKYNTQQRYKTTEIAMLEQLKNLDPCYGDVIKGHFRIRKKDIMERVQGWRDECATELKGKKEEGSAVLPQHRLGRLGVKEWDDLVKKFKTAMNNL